MPETIPFEYNGYHFRPYLTLRGKETLFDEISRHLSSDFELGICTYDKCSWQKSTWSYEDFYKASTAKYCDLFLCLENGNLYIPGKNELFRYTGTPDHLKTIYKNNSSRDER